MFQPGFKRSGLGEMRLLHEKEMGIWDHLREYGDDLGKTYVTDGLTKKDPIKIATGAVLFPASLLLEGPDQIYAALVKQPYEAPRGIAGRITRDTKLFVQDLFTGHPLRAVGDAFRVATADWILDTGDLLGGHHMDKDMRQTTMETRQQASASLQLAA